jgi:hypothetical protein
VIPPEGAAGITGTSRLAGLLALFVTFSAGIHAALAPEHLKEMPPLGYAFIAAAAIGCVLAYALITRPDDPRIPLLAGLFCLGQIAAWALFVTVRVPGFAGTPEGIETIALVSKAAELAAVALAIPLALPHSLHSAWHRGPIDHKQRSSSADASNPIGVGTRLSSRRARST